MIKEKKVREKKINVKEKGDRFERTIYNLFKKHWGVTAYKTPGSGAFTSRAVSRAMKEASAGDVVIEEIPELIFECKNYYSLHFSNWFKPKPVKPPKTPAQTLWNFWCKLEDEAVEFKKIPLLICKENNSPRVAIMFKHHYNIIEEHIGSIDTCFMMKKEGTHLAVFSLDVLLELDLETVQLIISDIVSGKKH
jgi:hypothetical protein